MGVCVCCIVRDYIIHTTEKFVMQFCVCQARKYRVQLMYSTSFIRAKLNNTICMSPSLSLFPSFSLTELARECKSCVLIHCMAGISCCVALTIAYLMRHMQSAYQYVNDRRPAITPNLNSTDQFTYVCSPFTCTTLHSESQYSVCVCLFRYYEST